MSSETEQFPNPLSEQTRAEIRQLAERARKLGDYIEKVSQANFRDPVEFAGDVGLMSDATDTFLAMVEGFKGTYGQQLQEAIGGRSTSLKQLLQEGPRRR